VRALSSAIHDLAAPVPASGEESGDRTNLAITSLVAASLDPGRSRPHLGNRPLAGCVCVYHFVSAAALLASPAARCCAVHEPQASS